MKKCAPISKGAGKRKATLKAKEKLRLTVEGEVSTTDDDDDDDDEDDDGIGGVRGGIHIVHVDNIVGGGVSGMCENILSRYNFFWLCVGQINPSTYSIFVNIGWP